MISRERTNEARDDPHIIEATIDPDSTADGYRYAQSVAQFLDRRDPDGNDVVIWTSSLQRAMQTAAPLGRTAWTWRALGAGRSGRCLGLISRATRAEFQARLPCAIPLVAWADGSASIGMPAV
jgi:hypothetical protein